MAEFAILQATDAAEARGDALGALRLIEDDLSVRSEQSFWRPERFRRLVQLAMLGPSLPQWATSRWILDQAAQQLDTRMRTRHREALDIAIETRGGPATLVGRDEIDAQCRVMDHDWVFRQVYLYELGALQHFVSRVASPDLLAGADRIADWGRAPMAAFRFVEEAPHAVSLVDLASGGRVDALNLGSAALLETGECAIGRLVPIDGGAMFESAPLFVPESVARSVASDPAKWLTSVAAGCREGAQVGSTCLSTYRGEFGLLTDVPRSLQLHVAAVVAERLTGRAARTDTAEQIVSLQVSFLRAALRDDLSGAPEGVNAWPVVAGSLLQPDVFIQFASALAPNDAPLCRELAQRLVAPASTVCRELAREIAAVA